MDRRIVKLLRFILPYWALELQILVCLFMSTLLNLVDPILLQLFIDEALARYNAELLLIIMIVFVMVIFFRSGNQVLAQYLLGFAGQRILFDIRLKFFDHLQRLGISFFSQKKIGEVLARLQNDVGQLQNILSETILTIINDVLLVLGIMVIIFIMNWKLSLLSLVAFPFFFLALHIANPRIRRVSRKSRDQSAAIMSFFEQVFTGIRLVKSSVREKHENRRFIGLGRELINIRLRLIMLRSTMTALISMLGIAGPVIVLWYGGTQVLNGSMTLGGLMAIYLYITRLFGPVQRLAGINITIQTAMASVDRIFEFLEEKPEVEDQPGARAFRRVESRLEFSSVSFAYRKGQPVLKDVSFSLERGKKVALVGPTGSGKSTVANLICRFHDPAEGAVLVDGEDIRQFRLSSYRRRISLFAQEAFLFNATIRENIRYENRRAGSDEIEAAARMAHIHQEILAMPDGYETQVGERGYQLSGGQRQRIAIARGLLSAGDVLVFDEATSGLDPKTEKSLQESIEPICRERMFLIIAHRISTIIDADDILVLDRGRVVERGIHSRLHAMGGLYRRLYDQQFRQGEIEVFPRQA